jgi:hypothetical protein
VLVVIELLLTGAAAAVVVLSSVVAFVALRTRLALQLLATKELPVIAAVAVSCGAVAVESDESVPALRFLLFWLLEDALMDNVVVVVVGMEDINAAMG